MRRTLLVLFGLLGGICLCNAQQLGSSGLEDGYFGWRSSVYRDLELQKTGKERFVELSNTGMDLRRFSDGSLGLWDDSIDMNQAYELWKLYEYGKVGSEVQEGAWDSFQVWTQGYLRRGIVPLLVVDFTYAQLTDSFWLRVGIVLKRTVRGLRNVGLGMWVILRRSMHLACFRWFRLCGRNISNWCWIRGLFLRTRS